MKDEVLKLEEIETSLTLGWAGEVGLWKLNSCVL
jgi:hypothetical protein